ncbi:unnamed protein product, partial [Penicillium pancosmium]
LNLPRTYTELIKAIQQLVSYTGTSPSGPYNSTKPGNRRRTGNGNNIGGGKQMEIGSIEYDNE